jgi:TetR/AcrR family transcriptional repressor of nem operon
MKRKHSKEDIIANGLELIREKGYNNTGIEDILKANGIPKGSFYNFFKSKEDFGIKALAYYTENQVNRIKDILGNPDLSPLERLRKFYQDNIEFNINEECRKGCLIGNMAQEMGGLSTSIGRQTEESLNLQVQLIAGCILEGQESGEIREDYSAADLADYVHNSFYGVLLRAKAGRDEKHFKLFMEMIFTFLSK